MKIRKHSAFTLIELLVVISIIAIIAALAMPAFTSIMLKSRMSDQMNNGRQIYIAMRSYSSEISHGGVFPAYSDPDDANTLVDDSNAAFEILMKRHLDDKKVFFNKQSAWCTLQPKTEANARKVLVGESDWFYVRGLKESANSTWPILANAFKSASEYSYVKDPGKKGGVWKGANAVVIFAGGSAEVVETKEKGEEYFIKRPDKPGDNAFTKTDDWLGGEDVKILGPKS
jgi:prepilin-type N-terminal cleavage/methylation domain-containing protein